MAARNMWRMEIDIHEKLCVKLVIYKDYIRVISSIYRVFRSIYRVIQEESQYFAR